MRFQQFTLVLILIWSVLIGCGQSTQVIPGHAHNDYENEDPLTDALEMRFISIEVDVHLANDELYVVHDRPTTWENVPTLQILYLDPLMRIVESNGGSVYQGYNGPFYLMVDFKTPAGPTYNKLRSVLVEYQSMLSV